MTNTTRTISLPNISTDSNLQRVLYLSGEVNQESVLTVIKTIDQINAHDTVQEKLYELQGQKYVRQPIELNISSYGGSVYCGLGLAGTIKSSETPIHTIATGKVMSMGFVLLLSGHKRFARPYTTYMYHAISTVTGGQLDSLADNLEECNRIQQVIDDIVTETTSIKQKKLTQCHKTKLDWCFDNDTALSLNVIQAVV